jgi:hypothetical protein
LVLVESAVAIHTFAFDERVVGEAVGRVYFQRPHAYGTFAAVLRTSPGEFPRLAAQTIVFGVMLARVVLVIGNEPADVAIFAGGSGLASFVLVPAERARFTFLIRSE